VDLNKWLKEKFVAKSFRIDLEQEHRPSRTEQIRAIEQYAAFTGEKLRFLRQEEELLFLLDKDCYRAELTYARERGYYGHRLICRQILEEEDLYLPKGV